MAEARILVARRDLILQVRVQGRATFKVSRELRDYAVNVLKKGVTGIIVDLSECDGMDSTFMGILAMVGITGRGKVDLVIVNAAPENRALLDGIGVGRLWRFVDQPVPDVSWESLCEAASGSMDVSEVGETVLSAHRALMKIDPDNIPKFKDVVEMLAADIEAG